MSIRIFIDNNVWDFLFKRQIDLAKEFPQPEFCICLTPEVELETIAIPEEKKELKDFINNTIAESVEKVFWFGFSDYFNPTSALTVGGFDEGEFADVSEVDFMNQFQGEQQDKTGNVRKKSGLYKNEADVALGARSLSSIVLTLDPKGPIKKAYEQGGKVIYLTDFDNSELTLADYIKRKLE